MAARKPKAGKAGTNRKAATRKRAGAPALPDRIFAHASPRSIGGVSLFAAQEQIRAATVPNFFSESAVINQAAIQLQSAGFEILQITPTTINIAGSADTYQRAFGTQIVAEERPAIKALGVETTATFLDSPDTPVAGLIATEGTAFEDVIEGVAIEEPRYYMAPSAFPPLRSYWHLHVPGDVSLGCNADRAHRTGITGRNVRVAMCDSGWFKHPYFVGRGYRVAPVVLGPGAADPLADEIGHGTGESANIFAVAPDVTLMPVKMSFVNSIGAFNMAVGLGPDIITCSWGGSKQSGPLSAADQALAAAIALAVASGIVVVFSAGNGHWGFPGQHPDVISAGGAFLAQDGTLQASNYASGFISNIYPGRRVPDLTGLVGMQPKAIYLMLPIAPGDTIDATPWNAPAGGFQGGTYPDGDETAADDGWGAFSGTSAAAPQLAGAAALVKQANPNLSPAGVRDVLMKTARDVTAGSCHPNTGGSAAAAGPDTATGNGLVDAHKAVLVAKVRALAAIRPAGVAPGAGPALGHFGDMAQPGHYGDLAQPGHFGDLARSGGLVLGHMGQATPGGIAPGHYGDLAQPGHFGDLAQPGHYGDLAQPGHYGDLARSGGLVLGHMGQATPGGIAPGHMGQATPQAAAPSSGTQPQPEQLAPEDLDALENMVADDEIDLNLE